MESPCCSCKLTHAVRWPKVNDLSSKKNRYKVDINASENHLTGPAAHCLSWDSGPSKSLAACRSLAVHCLSLAAHCLWQCL